MIDETKCEGCPFARETGWGAAGHPGCSHPDSGPRAVNLLSEMNRCPKDD